MSAFFLSPYFQVQKCSTFSGQNTRNNLKLFLLAIQKILREKIHFAIFFQSNTFFGEVEKKAS